MYRMLFVSLWVGACSFSPGRLAGDPVTDAPKSSDAGLDDAALDDAATTDASPDAAVVLPATTNHPSTADTFLASDAPTTNFNSQTSALVDGDLARVVLMRFDLSAISPSATVSAAEMHIWTDFDPGATAALYPVLETWSETQSTWNERSSGVAWTTAGAAPPSRGTVSVGTVTGAVASTEYVITINAATVNGWVVAPATNFGFVFVSTDADGTRFSTREIASVTSPPYLRVTHTP